MGPNTFDLVVTKIQNSRVSDNDEVVILDEAPVKITANKEENRGKEIQTHEVSHYCADVVISSFRRQIVSAMWESIQQKLIRTSFDKVPLLEGEVQKIFKAMSENDVVDLVPLQTIVNEYFQKVRQYNDLQSSLSSRLTLAAQDH